MKTLKPALVALVALTSPAALPLSAQAQTPATEAATPAKPAPAKSGHVTANGINYYYEIHGSGEPLLLLHGGLGSIDMFGPVLPALSANREVIAVDLQGHGRTELGDRPIQLPAIADDIAVVVKELGYNQVDVAGYSMGGGVAFRLAVQHPDVVRRVALISTGFAQNGFYPEMLPQQQAVSSQMFEMMKETPMYKSYVAVAPKPDDFPRLLDRMGELMKIAHDWREDVGKLNMPVMLVFADSDMYRLEHVVEFYKLLGGGQKDAGWMRENMAQNRLAIIPNRTHYDVFFAPELVPTLLPFLNGETKVRTWDELVQEQAIQ